MRYYFQKLNRSKADEVLPMLFRILYDNMSRITPTGNSYPEDEAIWLSYMLPSMQEASPEIVLMYAGEKLAGYCQYSLSGESMLVEEVEIKPEYQRTMLFFHLCIYLCRETTCEIKYVESYVNKQNAHSLKINRKLGLSIVGENKNGTSWRLKGNAEEIRNYFKGLTGGRR